MSVIVAGTCKTCGEKYWYSFGHPKWYKESNMQSDQALAYYELCRLKQCPACAPKEWERLVNRLVAPTRD